MKKFIIGVAATALTLSIAVEAEAAIKTVTNNVKLQGNKLLYKSNGKVVTGFVSFKKKVYKDGYLYTGIKDKTYYKKGVKASGLYKNKMYQKGALFSGVVKDTYYKKGVKASGTVDGKLYVKGALFSGVRNDILYKDGEPLNGTSDNTFYQHGVIFTGTTGGVRYEDGQRVEGLVDDIFYKKGKPFTGVIDQVLYINGENPTGYKVFEKQLYKDGALEINVVKVDHIWYTGGQVANGKLVSQDGQEIVVANGQEVEEEDKEAVVNENDDVSTVVTDDNDESELADTPEETKPTPVIPEKQTAAGYEVINGELYHNGKLYKGKYVYDNVLYDGGKKAVGVQKHLDLYYKDGVLANNTITYKGKSLAVKNGALLNGVVDGKYYVNGTLATGVVNGVLYENGNKSTGTALYNKKYYKDAALATGTITYNGKILTVNNGVPLQGVVEGKYYENGELATGVVNRIYYKDGVKATGHEWYNGTFFINGEQVDGIFEDNGTYYLNGQKATGLYDVKDVGVRYIVNGKLATGLHVGIYYENGERLKGFAIKEGKLYKDGVPNVGLVQYDDGTGSKWYYNTLVANGVLFTQTGEEIAVKDGKGITGFYNTTYYIDGKREQGVVMHNGELYKDGRPNNTFTQYEGIWYSRTQPANGIHQIGSQTILFENGLKFNGVYADRLYEDGVLKQGRHFEGGILYVDGIIEKKILHDGKLYVLGLLADELTEYDGKLYQAGGTLSVGTHAFHGTLYTNGVVDMTKQTFEGYLYVNGKLSEGADSFNGKNYLNGILVP